MLWPLPELPTVRQSVKPNLPVDKDSLEDQSIDYTHLIFIDCSKITEPCVNVIKKIFADASICFRRPPLLRCIHEAIPIYRLIPYYSEHNLYSGYRNPVTVIREAKIKYPSLTKLTIVSSCNLIPYTLRNPIYEISYSSINVWTSPCSYTKDQEEIEQTSSKITYHNLETMSPFSKKEWYNKFLNMFKSITN